MIDAEEEWKAITDLPHYAVSSYGQIIHVDRPDAARQITINDRGFPVVLLYGRDSRTRYNKQINMLVATAFLHPARFDNETAIWHLDGDLTNCVVSNLRWDTRGRVLEWNKMHRAGFAPIRTPMVKNNRTGAIYDNAYECGMAEGRLESEIVVRIEKQARHPEDDNARYRYIRRGQE